MANIHGKNAIVYLAPGTGAAIEISEINDYSLEADFDLADVTALGNGWAKAVRGIGKWTGKINANFNTAAQTIWSAFTSETPSNFYLYPVRANTTQYYYGTVWVKPNTLLQGGVSDKAKSSLSLIGDDALSKN